MHESVPSSRHISPFPAHANNTSSKHNFHDAHLKRPLPSPIMFSYSIHSPVLTIAKHPTAAAVPLLPYHNRYHHLWPVPPAPGVLVLAQNPLPVVAVMPVQQQQQVLYWAPAPAPLPQVVVLPVYMPPPPLQPQPQGSSTMASGGGGGGGRDEDVRRESRGESRGEPSREASSGRAEDPGKGKRPAASTGAES